MATRRKKMVGINTRLMIDVILASLIVQKAPAIIAQFIPLDESISNIAGIGAGYATGVFLKKPNIANASLALGVTSFVEPIIDGFFSGIPATPKPIGVSKPPMLLGKPKFQTVNDFISLNDYIESPGIAQFYDQYQSSY